MLTVTLVVALSAAPQHPWSSFPVGAWAQYQVGSTDYGRGAVQLVSATAEKVTLNGLGRSEGEGGWAPPGLDCPACVPGAKPVKREAVKALGRAMPAELYEFKGSDGTIEREWRSPAHPLPVKREHVAAEGGTGFTLLLTAIEPLFVGGQQVKGYRYEGTRTSGATMTELLAMEVPGHRVLLFVENLKTHASDLVLLEGFGLSGKPGNGAVLAANWHPWASFQPGAWTTTEAGKNTLTLSSDTQWALNDGRALPRGQTQAAADPSARFSGVAAIRIGAREYPCLVYAFERKDAEGNDFVRRDCQSVFARVPLYSEEKGSLAGVTYFDTYTAQTLEQPKQVAGKRVPVVTLKRTQKLSNGATSGGEVQVSPEVPGGTVQFTSTYELNGKQESKVTQRPTAFGVR